MGKVHSEFECVASHHMAQVIAHLIFVLIAQGREQSDGSSELIVAESFETRDRQGRRAEWKREREAEVRVARLSKVQQAGIEYKRTKPGRTEGIGIAEHRVRIF